MHQSTVTPLRTPHPSTVWPLMPLTQPLSPHSKFHSWASKDSSSGKSTYQYERGPYPEPEDPWGGKWHPTPTFLAWKVTWTEEPAGLRSVSLSQAQLTKLQPPHFHSAPGPHSSLLGPTLPSNHRSYSSPSQDFQSSTTSTQSFHHLRIRSFSGAKVHSSSD